MNSENHLVAAAELQAFIARAFVAIGISATEAATIAELMTRADVNGADSGSMTLYSGLNGAVIYNIVEDLRDAMEGLLDAKEVEESVGTAEVRATFKASRVGTIAGCYVTDGLIRRGVQCRLVRDGTVVYDGRVGSLRRFKDDVREVAAGMECGIVLENYPDPKEGDVIEAYEIKQVEQTLG